MMLFDKLDTEDKARQFRMDRLEKIENGKVLDALDEVPYCILHWLPISKESFFNPDILSFEEFSRFMLMAGRPRIHQNEDGFNLALLAPTEGGGERVFWNLQLFHSGALEMAFGLPLSKNDHGETKKIFPTTLTKNLRGSIDEFKKYTLSFGISVPVMVGISFFNVLYYRFHIVLHPQFYSGDYDSPPCSNKKKIALPEKRIKNLENMEEDMQLMFDSLWQVFGYDKCPDYYKINPWRDLDG